MFWGIGLCVCDGGGDGGREWGRGETGVRRWRWGLWLGVFCKLQFNLIKKNFNHPTRGNFVVVMAGS